MSADIFATLAARTLGRAEGLLPMTPSRFEPTAPVDASEPIEVGPTAAARDASELRSAPVSDPNLQVERRALIGDPLPTARAPTDDPLLRELPLAPTNAPSGREPTPAPASDPVFARETVPRHAEAQPANIDAISPTHPLVDPRLRPVASDEVAGGRPEAALQPLGTAPLTAETRRAPSPQAAVPAPPTVIVRIGRVDIHAAPPPAAPPIRPAPARAAPRPGLAEHLQARAEKLR